MRRKLEGIRDWKGGRQAYVEVNGHTHSKSYPKSTPIETLQDWRETTRKKFRHVAPERGTFAADIDTYLARVRAMRSYKQWVVYLKLWTDVLGEDRSRHSITADEIDRHLQQWLLNGTSPATVIKRRTALVSLFTTLDGKHGANPARASRPPRPAKPEARSLDYPTIARILDLMPESLTKRRVVVLAYTGLPPGMLMTVTPADLDLRAGTVRVRPRRKGKGVEARTLPLIPQGLKAFAAFHLANAYGPFAGRAANRVFQRACKKAHVTATLYDLRHSFGTRLYRTTRDLATVARFMLHSTTAMTERYAQAAMQDVDRAAAATMGRNLSLDPVPPRKPLTRKGK